MRRAPRLLPLLLACLGHRASAQRHNDPTTTIRVYLGAAVNQPRLWTLDRQPVLAPGTSLNPVYDTLALKRRLTPGPAFGLVASYSPAPLAGVNVRLGYLGLGATTQCRLVYFNQTYPGNNLVCASIPGADRDLGLVQFDFHAIVRARPHRTFSPYLELGLGLTSYNASTVEVEGTDTTGVRVVIDDPAPESVAPDFSVTAGIATRFSAEYLFHVEASETWFGFPAVTGPANSLGRAPAATRYSRHLVVSFGLAFVIDAKRIRRY